jgi:hypothetical protein
MTEFGKNREGLSWKTPKEVRSALRNPPIHAEESYVLYLVGVSRKIMFSRLLIHANCRVCFSPKSASQACGYDARLSMRSHGRIVAGTRIQTTEFQGDDLLFLWGAMYRFFTGKKLCGGRPCGPHGSGCLSYVRWMHSLLRHIISHCGGGPRGD